MGRQKNKASVIGRQREREVGVKVREASPGHGA